MTRGVISMRGGKKKTRTMLQIMCSCKPLPTNQMYEISVTITASTLTSSQQIIPCYMTLPNMNATLMCQKAQTVLYFAICNSCLLAVSDINN